MKRSRISSIFSCLCRLTLEGIPLFISIHVDLKYFGVQDPTQPSWNTSEFLQPPRFRKFALLISTEPCYPMESARYFTSDSRHVLFRAGARTHRQKNSINFSKIVCCLPPRLDRCFPIPTLNKSLFFIQSASPYTLKVTSP